MDRVLLYEDEHYLLSNFFAHQTAVSNKKLFKTSLTFPFLKRDSECAEKSFSP